MSYPKQMFRAGGPYGRGDRRYSVTACVDEEQERALAAKGWHSDKDAAFGSVAAEDVIEAAEELEEAIDEITPPTRDELEQKAKELDVSFNSRTKDETLAKRIAEALD